MELENENIASDKKKKVNMWQASCISAKDAHEHFHMFLLPYT